MAARRVSMKAMVRAIWTGHDKPERWEALADIEGRLTDRMFFQTFVSVWENSESNDAHLPLIDRLISARGVTAERVMPVLGKRDRGFLDSLPDPIPVYRGTTMENPYGDYSWSTDRAKAEWFARRCYEATPALATGMVRKADILFAYAGRGESEIAAKPDVVSRKRLRTIGPWQRNAEYKFFAKVQGTAFLDREMIMLQIASAEKLGTTPEATRERLYRYADDLEALGFKTAPARRRAMLDSIDWASLIAIAKTNTEALIELEKLLANAAE